MGRAWTEMAELDLCRGRHPRAVGNLWLLADFAAAFPSTLKRLAIPFRLSDRGLATESLLHTFPSLNQLNVGRPHLRDEQVEAVAEVLAILCPPGVVITRDDGTETLSWGRVKALVSFLHRVHVQRVRAAKHQEDAHRNGKQFRLARLE